MASPREFDLVIFGATGFTGALTVIALARLLAQRHASLPFADLRVAVAGRSAARLAALLERVSAEVPAFDASRFGTIIADVADAASMRGMAARARVLLSAAGPYRVLGEPAVAACVAERTHYLDVTGEPFFMERMALVYGEEAARHGVLCVSSCGFDSIPADLGCVFAVEALRRAGCVATEVESYLTLTTGPLGFGAHFATYESAVLGVGSAAELRALRRGAREPRLPVHGAPAPRRPAVFWAPRERKWALHFPGSDASVVRRTQRALLAGGGGGGGGSGSPIGAPPLLPVQYGAYFTVSGYLSLAGTILFGTVLQVLSRWAWGRRLLLAAPGFFSGGLFSHEGPSPAQRAATAFQMRFIAKGYAVGTPEAEAVLVPAGSPPPPPTHEAETVVGGPEPGYEATPLYLLGAAFTVLGEKEGQLPRGVLTPGAAFRGSSLLQRLLSLGLVFKEVGVRAVGK